MPESTEQRIERLAGMMGDRSNLHAEARLAIAGEYAAGGVEALDKIEAGFNTAPMELSRTAAQAIDHTVQAAAGSLENLSVVNVERFQNSFFFSISLKRAGLRVKVRDMAQLAEYLRQLGQEVTGRLAELQATGLTEAEARRALRDETKTAAELDPKQLEQLSRGNIVLPKTLSTTKTLLQSEQLDELNEFMTSVKSKLCGPFGVMLPSRIQEGLFVCPASEVERIEKELSADVAKLRAPWTDSKGNQRSGYIPAFLADYDAAITRAQTLPLLQGGLGPLFSRHDYPTAGEIAGSFEIVRRWLAIGVPAGLPESIRAEITAEFQRDCNEAASQMKTAIYEQALSLVAHLKDRLTVQPGEKPKSFQASSLENIQAFCDVFESRNVMFNDDQLKAVVQKIRATIANVTPDKLRTFESVRENVSKQFADIQSTLDGMIETRKGRKMYLDE